MAVVAPLTKGYDLEYIWKQVDRGAVKDAAERGVAVLGICNGFQILCEAHMLPGAMLRNAALKYSCKPIELEVSNAQTRFTAAYGAKRTVVFTQGNMDGNYQARPEELDRLEGEGQVVFRYSNNPNGSARNIAGIFNETKTVLGLMPHPEDATHPLQGSLDGVPFFAGLVEALN